MHSKHTRTVFALTAAIALGLSGGGAAWAAQPASAATSGQQSSMHRAAHKTERVTSDSWITTKVKTELATTKGVHSTDISVKTKYGVVYLTGVLSDKTQVKKAVAAAKSVKGVKRVDHSGLKVK